MYRMYVHIICICVDMKSYVCIRIHASNSLLDSVRTIPVDLEATFMLACGAWREPFATWPCQEVLEDFNEICRAPNGCRNSVGGLPCQESTLPAIWGTNVQGPPLRGLLQRSHHFPLSHYLPSQWSSSICPGVFSWSRNCQLVPCPVNTFVGHILVPAGASYISYPPRHGGTRHETSMP